MKSEIPTVFLDIESTGTRVESDRIVQLGLYKFHHGYEEEKEFLFNPGIAIPDEVIAVHGITNEMVKDKPQFKDHAPEVREFLFGCNLAGFNLLNFDVPLLWEEFYRAGIVWNTEGVHIIDAGNIFKKKEERSLTAAVMFYCGREHVGAHSALADAKATYEVLKAQCARYKDLPAAIDELAQFSRFEERIDLAGKFVRDKDGDAVYNFGKLKGIKCRHDDGSFIYWMLGKDFSQNTLMAARKILVEIAPKQRSSELF